MDDDATTAPCGCASSCRPAPKRGRDHGAPCAGPGAPTRPVPVRVRRACDSEGSDTGSRCGSGCARRSCARSACSHLRAVGPGRRSVDRAGLCRTFCVRRPLRASRDADGRVRPSVRADLCRQSPARRDDLPTDRRWRVDRWIPTDYPAAREMRRARPRSARADVRSSEAPGLHWRSSPGMPIDPANLRPGDPDGRPSRGPPDGHFPLPRVSNHASTTLREEVPHATNRRRSNRCPSARPDGRAHSRAGPTRNRIVRVCLLRRRGEVCAADLPQLVLSLEGVTLSGGPNRPAANAMTPAFSGGRHLRKNRRRPTLPGGLPPSTIGAGGLNCRVRNGNGCVPAAMATGSSVSLGFSPSTP